MSGAAPMVLRGRRVLVTGATGFLGSRLVERLVRQYGAEVRVLVSSFERLARIARFPVGWIRGDLLDPSALRQAAEGCEVVFHCAYGSRGSAAQRRQVTVEGTRHVLQAAGTTGARVVHVSTELVYGAEPTADLDETAPRRRSGRTYADAKLEAEELVRAAARNGLPATVLQPTAVYGPFAPVWTEGVLQRMTSGRVPVIDGGSGPCNAVYLDDVVDALLLAATSEAALGECFLVSAEAPVSWRAFLGAYERMLGRPATADWREAEAWAVVRRASRRPSGAREAWRLLREDRDLRARLAATREGAWAARLWRRLRPSRPTSGEGAAPKELERLRALRATPGPPPALAPSEGEILLQTRGARVRIDKAKARLGYRPRFDLEAGMARTEAWARWAGWLARDGDEAPAGAHESRS